MTIVKRADLGRPLTWAELDNNFAEVDSLVNQAQIAIDTATAQATIASQAATVAGTNANAASNSATTAQNAATNASAAATAAVQPVATDLATFKNTVANTYQRASFVIMGTFSGGGTATSKESVLYNGADGMYYTPASGTITASPGSSPTASWVCVGTMQYLPLGDIRNFKAKADGTDCASALTLAAYYSNLTHQQMIVTDGLTFDSSYITLSNLSYLHIGGLGTIRAIAGRTGQIDYAGGAQLTLINIQDLDVAGPLLDGNRDASPLYTGFAFGILVCTGTSDFRSNSGGANKPNRNIRVRYPTRFKNHGSFRAGDDKFGDAIYLFGVDGFDIDGVEFTDVGRWGVAGSEALNGKIRNCKCTNTKANSIALGFVDIETESTDPVYGTSAENIDIYNNTLVGFSQILVGAGNNSENVTATNHYIKNINVYNNVLRIPNGLTHAIANYETNLIYMGVAPFCNVYNQNNLVTNTRVRIYSNTLVHENPANLAIGIGMNAQGTGSGGGKFNDVSFIEYWDNTVIGFYKPLQVAGTATSTGYTLRKVRSWTNHFKATATAGSIAMRFSATQLVDCLSDGDYMEGSTLRGISIEDGKDIGAIDSNFILRNTVSNAASGVNYFFRVYRLSAYTNMFTGGGTGIDSVVTQFDKNYGNTWNSFTRSIGAVSLAVGGRQAIGNIDVGAFADFGYFVQMTPPGYMGQVVYNANVSSSGTATLALWNASTDVISYPANTWRITVEKR